MFEFHVVLIRIFDNVQQFHWIVFEVTIGCTFYNQLEPGLVKPNAMSYVEMLDHANIEISKEMGFNMGSIN